MAQLPQTRLSLQPVFDEPQSKDLGARPGAAR
jgi:hypothetical protein